jgi:hypothetical protein
VAREQKRLGEQSAAILALIVAGHSYEQILIRLPDLTYLDIFASASAALDLLDPSSSPESGPTEEPSLIERAREEHKRAYERWTADEDAQLSRLLSNGVPQRQIARELQRQRSAMRSRIAKLGLEAERSDSGVQPMIPASKPARQNTSSSDSDPVPGWDRIRQRLNQEPWSFT